MVVRGDMTVYENLKEPDKKKLLQLHYISLEWPKSGRLTANAHEHVEQQLSFISYGDVKWYSHFGR